jgi:phosphopantothenoylcysteine decarboxylase/phosphopantothenate--cysteine ligase
MERGSAAVLFAPTMHGSMHNSILVSNLQALHAVGCAIVSPRDDGGKHNLPSEQALVEACAHAFGGLRTTKRPHARNS